MINKNYKGLNIELKEDGTYYCVYEFTPIFKSRKDVLFGASADGRYNLEYAKNIIDENLGDRGL